MEEGSKSDGSRQQAVGPPEVLAVGAAKAAALFDVSPRTWARWDSSGKCPRGFKLGGIHLWRVADLEVWVETGFPDRKAFEAQQQGTEVAAVA